MRERICIVGGPRTGKTTLALQLRDAALSDPSTASLSLVHSDALIDEVSWSEQSEVLARKLDNPGPWIMEGVAVPRALRKWLAKRKVTDLALANVIDKAILRPCDIVYVLQRPHVERSKGQETMAKAVETVWKLVQPELLKRGVDVRIVESVTFSIEPFAPERSSLGETVRRFDRERDAKVTR